MTLRIVCVFVAIILLTTATRSGDHERSRHLGLAGDEDFDF